MTLFSHLVTEDHVPLRNMAVIRSPPDQDGHHSALLKIVSKGSHSDLVHFDLDDWCLYTPFAWLSLVLAFLRSLMNVKRDNS